MGDLFSRPYPQKGLEDNSQVPGHHPVSLCFLMNGSNQSNSSSVTAGSPESCKPPNPLINQNWWLNFGLSENSYVYGPMPRLWTGKHFRMQEARRMGWMAWTWNDEYKEERRDVKQSA